MSKKYISGNDDTLSRYFKDIKKNDLLTPNEEVDLAIRIQNGDSSAVEALVKANLKFVISIAKEYHYQDTNINDLISDGNEGLIKAALKFDHTRGFRFISYAVWWIRQSIIHGLNCNSRLVRLPANIINSLNQIKKSIERYELENEHAPCIGELANVKLSDLILNDKPTSLSTIINESGDELIEIFNCQTHETEKDYVGDKLIKAELDKMLSELSDREKDIISLYFGLDDLYEPMTLEGIGEKYNLTKERIRQLKQKALRK